MELLFFIVGGVWLGATLGFCWLYYIASKGAKPYHGPSCACCTSYDDTH